VEYGSVPLLLYQSRTGPTVSHNTFAPPAGKCAPALARPESPQ
jgi:hypothetical protein